MLVPALVTLGGWLILTFGALIYFSTFTLRGYFIIAFIGLLSITQIFAPVESSPRWWIILRRLVFVGYVVFVLILGERVHEIVF